MATQPTSMNELVEKLKWRERRGRAIALLAVGVPVLAGVVVLVLSSWQARQLANSVATINRQQGELKTKIEQVQVKDVALSAVRRQIVHPEAKIEFFTRDDRDRRVAAALRELGFQADVRPSIGVGPATDTLWFGSKVSLDEVKLVASILIEAGIPISNILPFRPQSPRANLALIQVGSLPPPPADPDITRRAPYTTEELRNATRFERLLTMNHRGQ
jgi:hypothetical protein